MSVPTTPTQPQQPQPSPETSAVPATTSPTPDPSPAASKLSPHALPFTPSSLARSKQDRWHDSPLSTTTPRRHPRSKSTAKPSYRDVVVGAGSRQDSDPGPQQLPSQPVQPPRIRLRSEIYKVSVAAPDAEGWRTVVYRRRRGPGAVRPGRQRSMPTGLMGRCFNCLARGHRKVACREPTRCLRCGQTGHRSFECKQGRRRKKVDAYGRQRPARGSEQRRAVFVEAASLPQQPVGRQLPNIQTPRPEASHPAGNCRCNHRRRGRRGGRRICRRNFPSDSDEEGNSTSTRPEPSSPTSPHSPSRLWNDLSEVCFIERSPDTDQWEAQYEYLSVLLKIAGTRPEVTLQQALAAVMEQFGYQPDDRFRIHHAAPLKVA